MIHFLHKKTGWATDPSRGTHLSATRLDGSSSEIWFLRVRRNLLHIRVPSDIGRLHVCSILHSSFKLPRKLGILQSQFWLILASAFFILPSNIVHFVPAFLQTLHANRSHLRMIHTFSPPSICSEIFLLHLGPNSTVDLFHVICISSLYFPVE